MIMENYNDIKSNNLQIAIKYSLILSLSAIALSLIGFITNTTGSYAWLFSLANYLITIFCILFAMKARRDELQNGFISYGQALGIGILVSFFAGILMALWQLVYQKFIDPEFFERMMAETKKRMIEQETPEETMERMIAVMKKVQNPTTIFFSTAFGFILIGTVFSLIIAAFVKKTDKSDSFTE